MSDIFEPKLTPRIRNHLHGIDLQSLSRIDASRLAIKAIPNIGSIELVTSDLFEKIYDALYVIAFPNRAERENSNYIIKRLEIQDAGERDDKAPYRIIGIRDPSGAAIGAAHISVFPLQGESYAVPYLQYIYVRAENRKQDMSEILHTMVLGVATADAAKQNRTVPFTLFESEPPGHGDDQVSQAYSHARLKIHAKTGGVALIVIRGEDGQPFSPHVQPGLELGDPPLNLLWVIRPSPGPVRPYDVGKVGRLLMAAYYQSLRDEGFPEKNICLAEQMVEERCQGSLFHLVQLADVPIFGRLQEQD